jgi:hypothetical protein
MAVNLDDPSTWDLDDKALLAIADDGGITDDADSAEPEVTKPEAGETEVVKPDAAEPETADIQAADGKHTIPYDVLRAARDDARAAKAEADRLRQELEALRTPAAAVAPPPAEEAPNTLPDDVQAYIDKVRENWGDDIAAQAERTYWLEQHALYQQQVIEQLSQHIQTQKQNEQQALEQRQRTEAEQIEDAIAASPKLSAWAKSEDSTWFDRAVELHAMLAKTDRAYASQGWHERMQQLPSRVEAVFGVSAPPVAPVAAQAKAKQVLESPPVSLSEMSGGIPPERTEFQKLEDLEGNALTAYMNKLAQDPRKFEAYLRNLV